MARKVGASLPQLSPQERALLGAAGATFVGVAALLVGYFVWDGLATLEERNKAMTRALRDVREHGDEYQERERNRESADRQVRPPPSLLGYLEEAAQQAAITIPESTERPAVPRGEYQEHFVDVKLRGVDLGALVQFLEKIEGGAYLVVTSQLSMRARFGQRDQLDVEASFSTYEKVARNDRAAPAAPKPESPQ